ncbi:MAG: hypothetical protein QGH24_01160 [Candidatus Marinimicrobia bacterium]|jgi:hypothetical protein|nr:hypothetical protein [Candidatus Neomarinimicrobiota bacterium]|tara:strand:+ start:509 stop:1036 length:528 start_codon:yes stop_codon:yes gene_type:complete
MNLKDKIFILIMAGLIVGGCYIWFTYTEITERMNQMETEQLTHIDEVNKEFRKDLKTLDLQFIGRGKHVRKAQKDIISNRELTIAKSDSLGSLIDDVVYNLNELSRDVDKHFVSVEQNIRDIEEGFDSQRRRINRRFSDIEQTLSTLQTGLKEIEGLSIIQTEKAKAKEKEQEKE